MSMFGSIVPLLVGSAMLMLDLARIGVLSWIIPVVQVVTVIAAVAFAVAQPNLDDVGTRALMVALLAPYLVTWLAIGVHLIRELPPATRDEQLTDPRRPPLEDTTKAAVSSWPGGRNDLHVQVLTKEASHESSFELR